MIAEIVAIGTELLMGQIADSDAQTLSRELQSLGIAVYHHQVVGDNPQRMREALFLFLLAAPLAGKLAQHQAAFIGQNTALTLRLMVELRLRKQIDHRARCARLGIRRAEHHARQTRMQHGSGAHGAWLQRHIQSATIEPVIAQSLRR